MRARWVCIFDKLRGKAIRHEIPAFEVESTDRYSIRDMQGDHTLMRTRSLKMAKAVLYHSGYDPATNGVWVRA